MRSPILEYTAFASSLQVFDIDRPSVPATECKYRERMIEDSSEVLTAAEAKRQRRNQKRLKNWEGR